MKEKIEALLIAADRIDETGGTMEAEALRTAAELYKSIKRIEDLAMMNNAAISVLNAAITRRGAIHEQGSLAYRLSEFLWSQ